MTRTTTGRSRPQVLGAMVTIIGLAAALAAAGLSDTRSARAQTPESGPSASPAPSPDPSATGASASATPPNPTPGWTSCGGADPTGSGCSPRPTPTATPTPSPLPAQVHLQINVTEITAGNDPLLVARVVGPDGRGLAGRRVIVWAREWGQSEYREAYHLSTDSDGNASVPVRPMIQTSYGLSSDGVYSPVQLVRVHTRIDVNWPQGVERRGGPWSVGGRVTPAAPNIPVGIAWTGNGQYRFLASALTDDAGYFYITVNAPFGSATFLPYVSTRRGLLRGARSVAVIVTPSRTVTATAPDDAGMAPVSLRVGDHLAVNLTHKMRWTPLELAGTALRYRALRTNPDGTVAALFEAVTAGHATVQTHGQLHCWPDTCPGAPELQFRVTVNVA